VRAKCLNLAGSEGVKARGRTLLYSYGQVTSWGSYTIVLSSLLVRAKSFTPSQAADFKGLRSEEPSPRVHLPSPAQARGISPVVSLVAVEVALGRGSRADVGISKAAVANLGSRLKVAARLGSVDRTKQPYRVKVLRSRAPCVSGQ